MAVPTSEPKTLVGVPSGSTVVHRTSALGVGTALGLLYWPFQAVLNEVAPPFGNGPFGVELSLLLTGTLPLLLVPGAAFVAGHWLERRDPGGAFTPSATAFGVGTFAGMAVGMTVASVLFETVSLSGDLPSIALFAAVAQFSPAVHATVGALAGFAVERAT